MPFNALQILRQIRRLQSHVSDMQDDMIRIKAETDNKITAQNKTTDVLKYAISHMIVDMTPIKGDLKNQAVAIENLKVRHTVKDKNYCQDDDKTQKQNKSSTLRDLCQEFSTKTTCHGLGNIFDSDASHVKRGVWTVFCLLCFGGLIYLTVNAITLYYSYPVSSTVTQCYVDSLPWPAITVCNRNLDCKTKIMTQQFGCKDIGLLGDAPVCQTSASPDDKRLAHDYGI